MRGSHSLLGRLPECCSWTCPQQKRKETWGLDLAAERCPSPGRHRPSSRLPAARTAHMLLKPGTRPPSPTVRPPPTSAAGTGRPARRPPCTHPTRPWLGLSLHVSFTYKTVF